MAIGSVIVAVMLWPKEDRLEIKHSHPGFWHEHPHDHNDPHHVHIHEDAAETDKHRHRHFHPPVTHKHRFVIDSHHTRWPMESGDRV